MLSPVTTQLKFQLETAAFPQKVWVAYSGGVDSHVLLHALAQLQKTYTFNLEALHVHHGLHKNAATWAAHCAQECQRLQINCHLLTVNIQTQPRESLEETARNARYAAFSACLKKDEYLAVAHHADDQAETFLLQLLRGAGTKGLSAMAINSPLGQGILWRPLLNLTRDTLLAYAMAHQLAWIEDDSNTQLHFDRNYIRHQVIPALKKRWPHFASNATQSARHCAEAEHLVKEVAMQDLQAVCEMTPWKSGNNNQKVNLSKIRHLSRPRRQNALRYWLKQQDFPLPGRVHLRQFEMQFIEVDQITNPRVSWANIQLRHYQNYLYILPNPYRELFSEHLIGHPNQPISLPDQMGILLATQQLGQGIQEHYLAIASLEVRFRRGGESIRLASHAHTHNLKKWFQALQIPPWERGRIPLIYIQGELAQVLIGITCYTAKKFAAPAHEYGWVYGFL